MNTSERILVAEQFGSDLSSRQRAAVLRRHIIETVRTGVSPVVVDVSGVRTMSESFADEVFGLLAQQQGEDWFRCNLSISGASREIRYAILSAIRGRNATA